MSGVSPLNRLERAVRSLGITMGVGACYDLLRGGMLLAAPVWAWGLVGLELAEGDVFVFRLMGLLLLVLGGVYLLGWLDTKRNVVLVAVAIIARVGEAVFWGIGVALGEVPTMGWLLALIAVGLGVVHYVFLRKSDFGFWEVLLRIGRPPSLGGGRRSEVL